MSADIIQFYAASGPRSSNRFKAIQVEHRALDRLAAELGSPDDWLNSAIAHLKVQSSPPHRAAGSTTVSVAALDLVLMRLEHLEDGVPDWPGNAS